MDILSRMLHELSANRPVVVITVSIGLGALLRSPIYLYYIIYTLVFFFTLLFVLLVLNFIVSLLYHTLFAHGNKNHTRLHSNPLKVFQPLSFSTPSAWSDYQISRKREKTKIQRIPLSADSLLISEEFDTIISYIMRDFVNSWFSKISDETVFSKAVEEVIREATLRVRDRLQKTDLLQTVVSRLLPLVTAHISDFRKAEVLLRGQALERAVTESDGLDLALAAKFRGGKFHPALSATAVSTVHTEVAYLKGLVNRILPYVLPEKELGSNPLKILVREMASCLLVQPVLQLLSDPDYWNRFVDMHLGKAIREQNMVNKLREALVKHAEELDVIPTRSFSAPNSSFLRPSLSTLSTLSTFSNDDIANGPDDPEAELIAPHYDRRSFEDFLRMIKECQNLLDIKRIRADVVAQIRKKNAQIEGRVPDEVVNGELVEDTMRYINQLGTAKRKAEKRIAQLSGGVERKGKTVERSVEDANTSVVSLAEVLSSPAGISYFMEFMDRLGQMIRVQFWLTIEGFRGGPDREEDLSDDNIPEAEQEERSKSKSKQDEAFRRDVRDIYDMYLAEIAAPHRIQINPMLLTEIRAFATNDVSSFANPEATTRARTSIFRAQEEIFRRMQKEDFPHFAHSDLYFKFLTTYQNSAPEGLVDRNIENGNLSRDVTQRKFRHTEKIFGYSPLTSQKRRESLPAAWESLKQPFSDLRRIESWDSGEQGSSTRSSSTDESAYSNSRRRLNGHIKAASDSSVFTPEGATSASVQSADEDDENYEAMADSVTSLEEAEAPPARFVSRDTIEAVEAVLRSIMGGSWVSGGKGGESTEEDTKAKKNLEYTSDGEGVAAVLKATGPGKGLMTSVDAQSNVPFGEDLSKAASESRMRKSSNDSESEIVQILGDSEESVSDVHTAPPGDLLLGTKIENLTEDIDRITQQEAIVDALIVKAEATNRTNELRILKKSKSALRRELQGLIYQKSQYELQESENVLVPGRSTVSITHSTVGRDHNKEFALYVIEVHQLAPDGTYAAGWIVTRRYSEFFALHQTLKEQYKFAKNFDLPGKRGLLRLQKGFVESRRAALEKYLQSLLANPDICRSQELRLFLSQQNVYLPPKYEEDTPLSLLLLKKSKPTVKSSNSATTQLPSTKNTGSAHDNVTLVHGKQRYINNLSLRRKKSTGYMKHIYKTVAEGIDDIFAGPSMLDVITQRLGEQVMQFSEDGDGNSSESGELESVSDSMAAAVEAAAHAVQTTAYPSLTAEGNKPVEHDRITRFTEPLCDLFIEVFELREKNNWLRRQAVQIILEQILGGKIERKLRETTKMLQTEDMIFFALRRLTDSVWPGGVRPLNVLVRTIEERQTTKDDANRKLSIWLPDILSNMVGRSNALRGARRIFTVFQNQRLNQQLLYELLDEVVVALFPEIRGEAVTKEVPL